MPTRYYCTYFDQNYLAKGLAMIQSLCRHNDPIEIYVVCMDDLTHDILGGLQIPELRLVRLRDIEDGDQALVGPKRDRSLVEYYWTLTPTIILRVLERHAHIDMLSYVDADLFFYSSTEPIFEEMANRSVLIHEHRFPPRLASLVENGIYNVGWLTFRDDQQGHEVLNWWRARCIEWCFKRIEDGKMGDQLYLNDWPERFEGVHVLQHKGAGLGPWNHEQYTYGLDAKGQALVDGQAVIFYHFHSLAVVTPQVIIPCTGLAYVMTRPIVELLAVPYAESLNASIRDIRTLSENFDRGIRTSGELADRLVFIAHKSIAQMLSSAPQPRQDLNSNWDLYAGPQLVNPAPTQAAPISTTPAPVTAAKQAKPEAQADNDEDSIAMLIAAELHTRGAPLRLRLSHLKDRRTGYITIHDRPEETTDSECSSDYATLHFPHQTVDELWIDGMLDVLPLSVAVDCLARWRGWLKPAGCLKIQTIDAQAAVARLASSDNPLMMREANRFLLGTEERPRTVLWTSETLGSLLASLALAVTKVQPLPDGTFVLIAKLDGPAPSTAHIEQLAKQLA